MPLFLSKSSVRTFILIEEMELTMRKVLFAVLTAALIFSGACKKADAKAPTTTDMKKASYAFGMSIGTSLKNAGMNKLDYNEMIKGMQDVIGNKKTALTIEEAQMLIQTAIYEVQNRVATENQEKGEKFLADNGKKPNVKTTASGLQYEVIKEGKGSRPKATDLVTVHYTGTTIDGKVFDSSIERNEPVTFALNEVIPGWAEGIQLMSVGSKYKLYIPSDLAYGPMGAGGIIGPNETLIFEVELIKIGQ